MVNPKRTMIRAKSSDFLQSIVEKSKQKEEPAVPQEQVKDMQKIEQMTNALKDKQASKPQHYWEKKSSK